MNCNLEVPIFDFQRFLRFSSELGSLKTIDLSFTFTEPESEENNFELLITQSIQRKLVARKKRVCKLLFNVKDGDPLNFKILKNFFHLALLRNVQFSISVSEEETLQILRRYLESIDQRKPWIFLKSLLFCLELDFCEKDQDILNEKAKVWSQELQSLTQIKTDVAPDFKLHFDFLQKPRRELVSHFTKALENSTNLKSIGIQRNASEDCAGLLENNHALEAINIGGDIVSEPLVNSLTNLTSLKELAFSLPDATKFDPENLNVFAEKLQNLSQLTHLTLNCKQSNSCEDEFYVNLAESLKQYSELKYLSLVFSAKDQGSLSHISNSSISDILKSLKGLKTLHSLEITFEKYQELIQNKQLECFSESINTLPDLKNLEMTFIGDQINDKGISGFIKVLADLKQLETLTIRFPHTTLSKEVFLEFIRALEGLQLLSKLNIVFGCNEIDENVIEAVRKMIYSLKCLDMLYMWIKVKEGKVFNKMSVLRLNQEFQQRMVASIRISK